MIRHSKEILKVLDQLEKDVFEESLKHQLEVNEIKNAPITIKGAFKQNNS